MNAAPYTPSIALILDAVSDEFEVNRRALLGFRRERHISMARQAAMWLARRLTARSFPEIGRAMGDRDHTTIMYGCSRIETEIQRDPALRGVLTELSIALSCPDFEGRVQ